MADNTQDTMEMGTKPIKEHEWLQNLVGEWKAVTEMVMEPGGDPVKSEGHESCKSLDGLWAYSEGTSKMPDGTPVNTYFALGYDVSFKEYRGCWFGSMSSHLWKYTGELSSDGKTMTLSCEGPDMETDGETAMYRDVHELIDKDHRKMTSYGQDKKTGEWQEFMTTDFYRV